MLSIKRLFSANTTTEVGVQVGRRVVTVPIPQARIRAVVPIPADIQANAPTKLG